MSGTRISFDEAAERLAAEDDGNERSTIGFPYLDLDAGIEVARAIYSRNGLGSCDIDELAAEMNQTVSGAFRMKTAAAKTFGLVDKDGRSSFKLTPLGQRLIAPGGEAAGRVEAFLTVPLYLAIYDKYRGHLLPPAKALEREMQSLGVSSKQTDKARQAFERSARQAGFFHAGDDRLVKPRLQAEGAGFAPETKPLEQGSAEASQRDPKRGGGSGGGGKEPPDRDELMRMLLRFLPEGELDNAKLARWLKAAEVNLRMAYDTPGSITIEVVDASS